MSDNTDYNSDSDGEFEKPKVLGTNNEDDTITSKSSTASIRPLDEKSNKSYTEPKKIRKNKVTKEVDCSFTNKFNKNKVSKNNSSKPLLTHSNSKNNEKRVRNFAGKLNKSQMKNDEQKDEFYHGAIIGSLIGATLSTIITKVIANSI